MRKITFLLALLCVSVMSWATIDWNTPSSTVVVVSDATQYRVGAEDVDNMPSVVGMQHPGWSEERGIYMTFPSADQLACSVLATKDGAGMVIFESNFAYEELTEVTVTWNGGSKTFYIHNDSPIIAPTTKAPTPTTALGRVRPVASQYAFNTQMSMLGWSNGMKQIDITREGSKFSCYKFGSYVGMGFGVTNVSQMNKIHLDLWTENAHSIDFYLHSSGQDKAYEISLSAGSWTSVDIPLSYFDNVNLTAVDEFKFANASLADQVIFIDNIYFYADADLPDPDPSSVADTDFALRSNGAIAYGSRRLGENYPAKAIDGDNGTLWETIYNSDPQSLVVDFGRRRIFNMVKIYWGNQYASEFYLETSNNGSDWTEVKHVTGNTTNHANSEQSFELASNATARYIRFRGIARANGYGYTIKSFSAILAGVPVLTSVDISSDKELVKIGEYATLTASPKDQNGSAIAASLSYSVSPEDAGHVTDGKYYPDKYAYATITVTAEAGGESVNNSVNIWGVSSDNLALNNALDGVGTWYSGDTPAKAVDGDDGSVWQGSTTNGNIESSKVYDAWCVIDLKGNYSLQLITIHFEGACSDAYKLYGSVNNEDWAELYSYAYPSPGDGDRIDNHTDWLSIADLNNADNVRYLKFKSTRSATQWGVKIYEMAVYGAEASSTKSVSATISPVGSGTVTITAGGNPVTEVASGTEVTFTATPNDGYIFVNWMRGGVEVATSSSYTATITANTALVANFRALRTIYCNTEMTVSGHTIYVTLKKSGENEYKLIVNSTEELSNFGGTVMYKPDNTQVKDLRDQGVLSNSNHTLTGTMTSDRDIYFGTPLYVVFAGVGEITYSVDQGVANTPEFAVPCADAVTTGVALSQTSANLLLGSTLTLTPSFTPAYATDRALTWETSNPSIATVDGGVVTPVATGSVTITAKLTSNNSVYATCDVTVVSELPAATFWGNGTDNGVAIAYSITRNTNHTLTYAVEALQDKVGFVVQVNDGDYHDAILNEGIYTWTSTATYTDGDSFNGFFYMPYYLGAARVEFSYTVGAENARRYIPITVSESVDNTSALSVSDGKTRDVTVSRSFTAGNLYTLVLPFNVDAAQTAAKLPGQLTKLNNSYEKANGDLRINFVDASAIEAGVPYLYKPSAAVANPTFEGVEVSAALNPTVADSHAEYHGIYAPMDGNALHAIDNAYVLGPDQYLYAVSDLPDNQTMAALRGYFVLNFPPAGPGAPKRLAKVVFNENETETTTDYENLQTDNTCIKVIVNGQLQIIRDGKTYNAFGQLVK